MPIPAAHRDGTQDQEVGGIDFPLRPILDLAGPIRRRDGTLALRVPVFGLGLALCAVLPVPAA
ncbi:hypothetical protein AB0I39_34890, partial [Kitasatospora purpeofusca]|uniref:hypothetical protein n=1 Tax=Kitasatospora purpeofusca TaxID=67352 RepID=UPI0033FDA892